MPQPKQPKRKLRLSKKNSAFKKNEHPFIYNNLRGHAKTGMPAACYKSHGFVLAEAKFCAECRIFAIYIAGSQPVAITLET